MKIKHLYLTFCILGIILPYTAYMPYFMEYGFSITDFISKIFSHPVTAFIGYDLLIAALVCLILMFIEGRRIKMKYYWVPMLCSVFIGLAFGLPLFLYLRELKLKK